MMAVKIVRARLRRSSPGKGWLLLGLRYSISISRVFDNSLTVLNRCFKSKNQNYDLQFAVLFPAVSSIQAGFHGTLL